MPPVAHLTDASATRRALEPGTRVEVRIGFDRSWADGFEVVAATNVGYQVRRRTDGQVLPTAFNEDAIRRERNNSMWWY